MTIGGVSGMPMTAPAGAMVDATRTNRSTSSFQPDGVGCHCVTCGRRHSARHESLYLPSSINVVMPTGLAVNKLLTNALKHALKGRDGGTITLHCMDDGDGCQITGG